MSVFYYLPVTSFSTDVHKNIKNHVIKKIKTKEKDREHKTCKRIEQKYLREEEARERQQKEEKAWEADTGELRGHNVH